MKRRRLLVMVVLIALGIVELPEAHAAGLEDLLRDVKRAIGLDQRLSTSKIIEGLKEALKISSSNAVKTVSKVGGYYDNPKIKIPLPGAIKKVEKLLRATGFGPKLDAFELSLNRAAEQAAPEAKAIARFSMGETTRQPSTSKTRPGIPSMRLLSPSLTRPCPAWGSPANIRNWRTSYAACPFRES